MKHNIKIPTQYYIGVVNQLNNLPSVYMTPNGSDGAATNRKATIDSWIARCSRSSSAVANSLIIANEPLVGFSIRSCLHDTWMVEDPRGFRIEISANNLLNLMKTVTIHNGEIFEPCVWARSGSNNVLMSVKSEEYKLAVSNTKAANRKASWRDVKPGNEIILQNNLRGIYLGKMWTVSYGMWSKQETPLADNDIKGSDKSVHVILEKDPNNKKFPESLHLISAPKLSSITDNTTFINDKDREELANEKLFDTQCYLNTNSWHKIIALSSKKVDLHESIKLVTDPVTYNNSTNLMNDISHRKSPNSECVFIKTSDAFGRLSYYNRFNFIELSYDHFLENEIRRKLILSPSQKSYYNLWSEVVHDWEFNTTDQLMTLTIEVHTESGNILKYTIK